MDQMPPKPETQIVHHVQVAGIYNTKNIEEETQDSIGVRQRIQSLEKDISSNKNLPEVLLNLKENCETNNEKLLELTQKHRELTKEYDELVLTLNNKISKTNSSLQAEIAQVESKRLDLAVEIELIKSRHSGLEKKIENLQTEKVPKIIESLENLQNILNTHLITQQRLGHNQKRLTFLSIFNFLGLGASCVLLYYLWQHTHK